MVSVYYSICFPKCLKISFICILYHSPLCKYHSPKKVNIAQYSTVYGTLQLIFYNYAYHKKQKCCSFNTENIIQDLLCYDEMRYPRIFSESFGIVNDIVLYDYSCYIYFLYAYTYEATVGIHWYFTMFCWYKITEHSFVVVKQISPFTWSNLYIQ